MQTYLWRLAEDKAYESVPHKDHLECQVFEPESGPMGLRSQVPLQAGDSGAELKYARLPLPGWSFPRHRKALREMHRALLGAAAQQEDDDDQDELIRVLPDLTGWSFNGTSTVNKVLANTWVLVDVELGVSNTYIFYASAKDNTPLRLHLLGYNFVGMSHFDEYVFDYLSYQEGPMPEDVFEPPKECRAANGASGWPAGRFSVREAYRLLPRPSCMQSLTGSHATWSGRP